MSAPVNVPAVLRHRRVQMETASLRKVGFTLRPLAAAAIAADLRLVEAAMAELIEALDHIGGLSRALRVGGPDPTDLHGLSDALDEAVDTAHAALARVQGGAQ